MISLHAVSMLLRTEVMQNYSPLQLSIWKQAEKGRQTAFFI